jgi:hypothetical protein
MAGVRADLVKHVGGNPSAAQRMMIDQAAMLSLRLRLMDRQALQDGGASDRNGRQYLAFANSLSRLLRQFGLEAAKAPFVPYAQRSTSPTRGATP